MSRSVQWVTRAPNVLGKQQNTEISCSSEEVSWFLGWRSFSCFQHKAWYREQFQEGRSHLLEISIVSFCAYVSLLLIRQASRANTFLACQYCSESKWVSQYQRSRKFYQLVWSWYILLLFVNGRRVFSFCVCWSWAWAMVMLK